MHRLLDYYLTFLSTAIADAQTQIENQKMSNNIALDTIAGGNLLIEEHPT